MFVTILCSINLTGFVCYVPQHGILLIRSLKHTHRLCSFIRQTAEMSDIVFSRHPLPNIKKNVLSYPALRSFYITIDATLPFCYFYTCGCCFCSFRPTLGFMCVLFLFIFILLFLWYRVFSVLFFY